MVTLAASVAVPLWVRGPGDLPVPAVRPANSPVAPATVMTPTFGSYHNVEQRIQAVPIKRAGKPEELAAAVAFFASEHAGFITGENLQMDGGQTRALV